MRGPTMMPIAVTHVKKMTKTRRTAHLLEKPRRRSFRMLGSRSEAITKAMMKGGRIPRTRYRNRRAVNTKTAQSRILQPIIYSASLDAQLFGRVSHGLFRALIADPLLGFAFH